MKGMSFKCVLESSWKAEERKKKDRKEKVQGKEDSDGTEMVLHQFLQPLVIIVPRYAACFLGYRVDRRLEIAYDNIWRVSCLGKGMPIGRFLANVLLLLHKRRLQHTACVHVDRFIEGHHMSVPVQSHHPFHCRFAQDSPISAPESCYSRWSRQLHTMH